VTAYRALVLEHFRRPRNRGSLAAATVSEDGANALCGDRIRVELRIEPRIDGDVVRDAMFTADACALCIASASVLTEHVKGRRVSEARAVDATWISHALGGEPPRGSVKCALLPLTTMHRALAKLGQSAP
jgi:nitrogen fixation protein NifU and related proteins